VRLPVLDILSCHPALFLHGYPREILLLGLHDDVEACFFTPSKLKLRLVLDEDVQDVFDLEERIVC